MVVYKVTNNENGKVYIGKTHQTLKQRKWAHYNSARNSGSDTNFHRALRKYPKDSFQWEVIATTNTDVELNNLEMQFITEYDSFKSGYNMTEGGDGGFTYKKGTEMYDRIKHKLGKWKNGNPGATTEAIAKRLKSFKDVEWPTGEEHSNYGHSHNKGILVGELNPMYGKTPTNARRVIIDGITYPSVASAARNCGVGCSTIRRRCKNLKIKNYKYE